MSIKERVEDGWWKYMDVNNYNEDGSSNSSMSRTSNEEDESTASYSFNVPFYYNKNDSTNQCNEEDCDNAVYDEVSSNHSQSIDNVVEQPDNSNINTVQESMSEEDFPCVTDKVDVTVEIYKFEIDKLNKIQDVLKKQLENKDIQISKLSDKVEEFEHWKSQLDANKDTSIKQYQDACHTIIELNNNKILTHEQHIQNLSNKLQQMECEHNKKDAEIRELRERLLDYDLVLEKKDMEISSLVIDKQMLKDSIYELEKTYKQREMKMKLEVEIEYQSQLKPLLSENDKLTQIIDTKDSEIEELNKLVKNTKDEYSKLLSGVMTFKEVILRKNEEIKYYKDRLINMESEMVMNDRTSELKVSVEVQNKLKDKCRELECKLSKYEIAAKLRDKVGENNMRYDNKLQLAKTEDKITSYNDMGLHNNQLLLLPQSNIKRL